MVDIRSPRSPQTPGSVTRSTVRADAFFPSVDSAQPPAGAPPGDGPPTGWTAGWLRGGARTSSFGKVRPPNATRFRRYLALHSSFCLLCPLDLWIC
eukprot:gene11076-biopygen4413